MDREQLFENTSIPKAVLKLAVPTILGMLVTVVYNMADTYFVGQTGDASKVAAVSLCLPFFYLFLAVGNLFGVGGGTYISRLLGVKDKETVKQVSSFCFYACLGSGIVLGGILLLCMEPLLHLIGTSPDTYAFTREYLIVMAIGAPAVCLQHALGQIVRSEGAAGQAMTGMMIGTVLNIILDPLMISVWGWGCRGAAIATVIGNISSVLYYMFYLLKKNTWLSISPAQFRAKWPLVSEILKIGVPTALNVLLMCCAQIILNSLAATYSDATIAALGICNRIAQVPRLLIIGLSQGTQPFTGYNYSSGNHKRMNSAIRFAGIIGVSFGILAYLFIFFNTRSLVGFFLDDAEVIALGAEFLKVVASVLPFITMLFLFMHSMQAFGKGVPATIISVCRDGVVFIPAVFLLNSLFGVSGILWAQPLSDIITTFLSAGFYFKVYTDMKHSDAGALSRIN